MNKTTIGICSICGGVVTLPAVWDGILAPDPSCESCGAVKRSTFGPFMVVPMRPAPKHSPPTPTGNPGGES